MSASKQADKQKQTRPGKAGQGKQSRRRSESESESERDPSGKIPNPQSGVICYSSIIYFA
jgi:hypothetical protein